MDRLDIPLNATEKYLYGINVRLDAIIHMLSSMIEVYANQNNVAVTQNEVKDEVKIKRTKK
jgi:hypothetical protein